MTTRLRFVSTQGEFSADVAENGDADEIDLVLSHTRDEEHASDPKDNPQTNLVCSAIPGEEGKH